MVKQAKIRREAKWVTAWRVRVHQWILQKHALWLNKFLKRGLGLSFTTLALVIGGLTPLLGRAVALGEPPVAEGLRFVKVHLREGTSLGHQFVVLRNFGAELKLADYQFVITHKDSETERLDLGGEDNEVILGTGEFLVLYKNQATLDKYLQVNGGIKICSKKCDETAWLRANSENVLQVVKKHSPDEIIAKFKYNFSANDPYRFKDDYQVWVYDQNQALLGWRSYKVSALDQPWLGFNQFPIIDVSPPDNNQPPDSPAEDCADGEELVGEKCLPRCQTNQQRIGEECLPKCSSDQELVGDRCLKKCAEDEFRNPETNRCNKIKPDPEPKSCPEGFFLNPSTNRCNKIPEVAEPKTCPEGSFLNPTTNRCNKIAVATVKPPCPEGQLRHPETGRCRKIVLESDCQDGYELSAKGNCVKKCQTGYERNPNTGRCQKSVESCQEGFGKDPKTGICTKALPDLPVSEATQAKEYKFSWLKLLNSPLSGAVVSSIIFAVYDKSFRNPK